MKEQEYLIETITMELAKLVMQDGTATTILSALDTVYNSDIYNRLCNPRTGLLYQHPGYVYCYLLDELHANSMCPKPGTSRNLT